MFTMILVGVIILVVGCVWSKLNDRMQNLFVYGGIAIVFLSIFICPMLSAANIPDSMQGVPYDKIGVVEYYTDGEKIYARQGSVASLLIPGAAMDYEECDPPEGYCANCSIIRDTAFCVDCGQELRALCPSCETECDTTFCGKCGAKVRED